MRKLLLTALTLILTINAHAQSAPASELLGNGLTSDINLLFIGNSITQGATLPERATQNPCVQAARYLKEQTRREVNIRNCGRSGMTTHNFLPGGKLFAECLAAGRKLSQQTGPLFVSIMLGTNDSAERGPTGSPVSTATYRDNLRLIIDQLLDSLPTARIILQYPIWYSPNTENSSLYAKEGLARLLSYHPVIDALVEKYAEERPGRVFAGSRSPYQTFEKQPQYFTPEKGRQGIFYLHPNPTGAKKLGELWAEHIINIK